MDFAYDGRTRELSERLTSFMRYLVYWAEPVFADQAVAAVGAGRPWERRPVTA
jgi:hypothetical protein